MPGLFGESPAATSAKKFTKQAVGSLQSGQQVMEGNPAFQGAMGIAQQQTASPLSLSPEILQMLKQRMFDDSATAFQGGLDSISERMGARSEERRVGKECG